MKQIRELGEELETQRINNKFPLLMDLQTYVLIPQNIYLDFQAVHLHTCISSQVPKNHKNGVP